MGFLNSLANALFSNKVRTADIPAPPAIADGPPTTSRVRHFVVHDALNGHYIEYTRRKYNPHGADDFAREIYIVQPGEPLIDAISAVLVIMEK